MIDYSSLDYISILNTYSVKNISKKDDELQFSCVFDGHKNNDANPSCSLNTTKGTYNCFGCGAKGTIVDWVAKADNISKEVAEQWILNDFKGKEKEKSLSQILEDSLKKYIPKFQSKIPEGYLKVFEIDWDFVEKNLENPKCPKILKYPYIRGFKTKTLQEYDFGYDKKSNRLVFPIRDLKGDIRGFKGRCLDSRAKYKPIGDREGQPPYYGFKFLKNGDFVYLLESNMEQAIVCEGEFDALLLRQRGFEGAVSIGGSNPTPTQIRLLKKNAATIYLALDNDKAGKKAENKLLTNLIKTNNVYIVELPEGHDPADCSIDQFSKLFKQARNPLTIQNKE